MRALKKWSLILSVFLTGVAVVRLLKATFPDAPWLAGVSMGVVSLLLMKIIGLK